MIAPQIAVPMCRVYLVHRYFFFNATATTEIYTLSLHDALPISATGHEPVGLLDLAWPAADLLLLALDRKSTRLNSSHPSISYAVFCLKKKNTSPCTHALSSRQQPTWQSPSICVPLCP